MSPIRTAEHRVHNEGERDEIIVREPRLAGNIEVTWFCGDTRQFSKDDLKAALANVDRVAGLPVTLDLKDTAGRRVIARVVDGKLYADDRLREDMTAARYIDWADLRKVLTRAAK